MAKDEKLNVSAADLDWKREITLDVKEKPLREALDLAAEQAGFSWRWKRGILALTKKSGDYFTLMSETFGQEAADYHGMTTEERQAFLKRQVAHLFSSLTDEQKAAWKRDGGLPMTALTADQLNHLKFYRDTPALTDFLPEYQMLQNPRGIKIAIGHAPGSGDPEIRMMTMYGPNFKGDLSIGGPLLNFNNNFDLPVLQP